MKPALARQRAILARLALDALRGLAGEAAYYPTASLDYNMIMIRAFVVLQGSRGSRPTASRIARGLHMPRTTVTRLLQRLEQVGLLGRGGTGYYATEPPGTDRGIQFIVELVLRTARDLTETGRKNS